MSIRTEQIASVIQNELSLILFKHLDHNKYGFISITKVKVLEDLSEARVFLKVEKNLSKLLVEIKNHSRKINAELVPRITAKKMPKLVFASDAENQKLENLLNIIDSL